MHINNNSRDLSFAVLVVAAVFAAHLEFPLASQAANQLFGTPHAPGFGPIAIGIWLPLRNRKKPAAAYFAAFVSTLLLALASEAARVLGPRDADLADVL